MSSVFQAFGIRVKYPSRFRIYINQRQPFEERSGMIKFDDTMGNENSRLSLTVSWEPAEKTADFALKYLQHAEEHYAKKVKKRYRVVKKELIKTGGHETAYLHTLLQSQTHVMKAMGKSIQLEIMQTAKYCDNTGRIILVTLLGEHSYFAEHKDALKLLLLSVECHADTGSEEPDLLEL